MSYIINLLFQKNTSGYNAEYRLARGEGHADQLNIFSTEILVAWPRGRKVEVVISKK